MKTEQQFQLDTDPQVFYLYYEYSHGDMNRRVFLSKADALVIVGGSGLAMA